ncbi:MAG TPA: hypothetical protein OIM61_08940 [Clostridiaceae bacterium]|jgi:hypothetical protein|nr:hypothetical protein [Clostridiaceae bacterium]
MFNKFKNNQCVIVNGFGKCNNKLYQDAIGTVICRDPYYLDYNIRFEDGTEDWLDGICLVKYEGVMENEN